MFLYYTLEMSVDILRTHISQPKYDDTGEPSTTGSNEFPEIQIMGEQNETLLSCFGQDRRIFQAV